MKTMNSKKTENSLWTKDFLVTTFSNLFLFFSFQMLIPTLPEYTKQAGGDAFAVGLVIGTFTLTALIARPFVGKALDRINQGKVLLAGLIIFALSVISYNWMTTVAMILGLRLIHGVGWGIATTSLGTIISNIIPAKRRGEGMGYYGLSTTIAMATAPLLGIWIINTKGFTTLFAVSFFLALFSIVFSRFIKNPVRTPIEREEGQSFWTGLYEKKALFPSLLVMLFAVTYGGVVGFITLFGKEVNIQNVGAFFTANAIMVMLVRPVAGILFDKKGHQWVVLPGVIFSIVGLIVLSYTTSIYMLILSGIFYGTGFGMVQPSLQAWTINRVPPNRRGAANGTFFSAFDLGIGLGSIILGSVARATSYSTMYRLSISLLFLYIILYLLYLRYNKKESFTII